jgi:phage baseplate assembly protein W
MTTFNPRLGTGLGFPLLGGSGFRWVSGAEAVEQALRHLLLTEPGERLGRPGWGCGLRRFLFAQNNVTTHTLVRQTITEAIQRWEHRVELDDVVVEADPDQPTVLSIDVRYRMRGDPGPKNLVFPFYLDGGAR